VQKQNLNELIEYNDKKFCPKVLVNEPGYRMVLLSMRAAQSVPEHATPGMVTVYAIRGHITFYEGSSSCDLRAGEVLYIESGSPHRLEAHEDSALFVLNTGKCDTSTDESEEIDVRKVPLPLRHPLIFEKFDALAIGDFIVLVNDHDPVPLNRQMESMRPGQAKWEYIKRGPDLFRIRIRRAAAARS